MARLSMSEQINAQASEISNLKAEIFSLTQRNEALRINADQADTRSDARNKAKIEELEKKIATQESSLKYQTAENAKIENELEQAHAVLDCVDGAPESSYDGDYGKKHRNVVTRLAGAFLAIAKNGGAK